MTLWPYARAAKMSLDWKDFEYWVAATQLVFAMLGMGATLTLTEFRQILKRPWNVLFVLFFQYQL